ETLSEQILEFWMAFDISCGVGAGCFHFPAILTSGVKCFLIQITCNAAATHSVRHNGMGNIHNSAIELVFHDAGEIIFYKFKLMCCLIMMDSSCHGNSYAGKNLNNV